MKQGSKTTFAASAAMRLLSRREHCSFELRAKLARRGFEPSDIEQALAECRRLNALDDGRFAAAMVRHMKRRGYGPAYMRRMLESKRLDQETIENCLAPDSCSDEAQLEACATLLDRKMAAGPGDASMKARLFRFLKNRGFSIEVIRLALDRAERKDGDPDRFRG